MPAAPFAHGGQHRLDHRHGAEHIDLELAPQVVDRRFLQNALMAIAGVVDEHVDRADAGLDRGHRRRDPHGVGDVEDHRMRVRAERFERLDVARLAHGPDDDMAVLQGRLRQRAAESGRNAGDEKCFRHGGPLFNRLPVSR